MQSIYNSDSQRDLISFHEAMNKLFYLLTFVVIVPFLLAAQDIPGWRAPAPSELGADIEWRAPDPDRYLVAKADFDGDGKEDEARLLINDRENKTGLFVFLSSRQDKPPLLVETMDDKHWIEVAGISVAKAGKYKTKCGKGYWQCEKGVLWGFTLKKPAIDLFRADSANLFLIWDNKSGKFGRIWVSD